MKSIKIIRGLALALLVHVFAGCAEPGTVSKPYAELHEDASGRIQVQICDDVWRGVFTVHGYGGYAHGVSYWATVTGPGPTYVDPVFHENSMGPQYRHRGTITLDRSHDRVTISLQRLISKPGEPERLEPSPANGSYPINKITRGDFMRPE